MNALLYQNRTGCQWRMLPLDLLAWLAVFYYFTLCVLLWEEGRGQSTPVAPFIAGMLAVGRLGRAS